MCSRRYLCLLTQEEEELEEELVVVLVAATGVVVVVELDQSSQLEATAEVARAARANPVAAFILMVGG